MVLPPSAADDAPGPAASGWLRRLKVSLGLSRAGLLVLVDHARPERLGELVRALLPIAPELEVHTEAHRLAEARPGATLVLVARADDADWLNLNRPLFASRALRVVLFCTREVTVALSRGAVDFLDWISLRLECPAGSAPYAVAGLRCALAARVPGIVWTGGDLEASFAAARPNRTLRRISAARPYEELVAEAQAASRREWLAWTDVDGDFRLRRVRWALAEARRRTRTILVEPAVRSPGWWEVHGRAAEPAEACERLRSAGATQPGRLAALVDLEPEAIQLLGGLLERGVGEHSLEAALLKEADSGAVIGRLASVHGLVIEKELARGRAPSPAMRAFGAERARMRQLQEAELDAIAQRASQGESIPTEDAAWWSACVGTLPAQERLDCFGERSEIAEALLRHAPRTGQTWEQSAFAAISTGDMDVAHVWSQKTLEAEPKRWGAFIDVLRKQERFAEAESFLRRHLSANEQLSDVDRGWLHHQLSYVLFDQGQYAEAEDLLRRTLAVDEQVLDPRHRDYAASLHLLGLVLSEQGKYAEAEKLLRQSLAITERGLEREQELWASLLHDLAGVVEKQGRYAEAEKLLRQSLSLKRKALGPKHPSRADSLYELAWVLERQGRYAAAEDALRKSLALTKQAFGPQHPSSTPSLNDLAGVYLRQGRYAEAEELLLQSLAITEQTAGREALGYGASLHELARVRQRQGRYTEAEELLRQSLDIKDKTLGGRTPGYATSLHQLAVVLQAQGRYAEADVLLRQSLEIVEQILGSRHPQLGSMLATLGNNLAKQGRPQEGEPLLLRSVDIALETWGWKHPETGQLLDLLAHVQASLKKPEAVTTARQAMDSLLGALGPEHPITKEAIPRLRHLVAGNT